MIACFKDKLSPFDNIESANAEGAVNADTVDEDIFIEEAIVAIPSYMLMDNDMRSEFRRTFDIEVEAQDCIEINLIDLMSDCHEEFNETGFVYSTPFRSSCNAHVAQLVVHDTLSNVQVNVHCITY